LVLVFDGFNSWQLVFVNPIHELPRFSFLVGNFLDFEVKEGSFGEFDCFLESFPIF